MITYLVRRGGERVGDRVGETPAEWRRRRLGELQQLIVQVLESTPDDLPKVDDEVGGLIDKLGAGVRKSGR